MISTAGRLVLLNYGREDVSHLSPCTQDEADSRLLLHAADATANGCQKVMLCTVDTDVLVISIALFSQMNLKKLWLAFGTGNNFRYIPAHVIAEALGPEKSVSLLMFHAFTSCDQASFFMGRGKKTAWEAYKIYPDVVDAFAALGKVPPTEQALEEQMSAIERFVVITYDRTSSCNSVDDA